MKKTLEYLFEHKTLSREKAKGVLVEISKGETDPIQVASFLTIFRVRGITVEELAGFRDALRELCVKIDLSEFSPVDLCGTGGDGKDTFNISTLSSFVTAGAGVKVAKHGNYAVSSSCGSSNMMEFLGYKFTNEADKLRAQIDKSGICFLHAPLFHPAMKSVAPIRRSLGVRTFFNMLGPMVSPAFPPNQIVGVFSLELQRLYQYILQDTDINYRILHAMDGYDEISLTSDVRVVSPGDEQLLSPDDFGSQRLSQESLFGGKTVEDAAAVFVDILEGKGTDAQNSVVKANSGMAISCAKGIPLEQGIDEAGESLRSGKAKQVLKTLLEL